MPMVVTVNTQEPDMDKATVCVSVSNPPGSLQKPKEGYLDLFLKLPIQEVFDMHAGEQWKASGQIFFVLSCLVLIMHAGEQWKSF